ncbi:ATP-binding protein [Streptomyces sp. NBC_01498]|uniref:ATP-binding protein n=1 Tax=Streptomyces sp. NBC_01498 TaxID=2975870 RepID=UPI002E7AEAC6|nr:ATP-binding protein [Streptomyces sp. NBC_01498]WTL26523.1 ATP-binding protein [Streptomyces sp. NBC_01498]
MNRPANRRSRRAAWWLSVLVLAAAAAAAIAQASADEWRQALAGGCAALAVLLLAWVIALHRRLRVERADRDRERRTSAARGAEMAHLASVRVPAIAERVRAGRRLDGVPGPVAPDADTGEEFARALAAVVAALGSDEAVRRERGLRDSVQAAFESVARNMHAMATVQQQVLDHVERAIDDPRLMADVMKADHAASQMTRKAQTLLVMCGIWPARRESQPVSLYDCVRGAQSRIVEFGRVEVHGGQTLFVVPPAVEGLMHAIAELLENATVFSPSRTQVIVTIREVGAGAVVEIDDAGLGMPPDVLHQAMSQLKDDLDLTRLGAVPRLGLACVGRWGRELGFNVELTGASAYGGTRAVTFVPHRLLTEPLSHFPAERGTGQVSAPAAASVPVPASAPAGGAPAGGAREHERPAAGAAPVSDEDGPGALPRRRSRRRAADAPATTAREQASAPRSPEPARPDPAWTPEAARASITSVVSGSRRGRAAAFQDTEQPDQHDGGRQ